MSIECKDNYSLTVFSNLMVDDTENLRRSIDSASSFRDIKAEKWIINIRGRYKEALSAFLVEALKERVDITFFQSRRGWFFDTRALFLKKVSTDYVLYWVEDHINMVDTSYYSRLINEMGRLNCDHMLYSFYEFGDYHRGMFKDIAVEDFDIIQRAFISKEVNRSRASKTIEFGYPMYSLVSLVGIFKREFFNRCLCNRWVRQASKFCPHDFEIPLYGDWILPITYAIPRQELFASIDDTRGRLGYSLIDRGLYPLRGPPNRKLSVCGHRPKESYRFFKVLLGYSPLSRLAKIIRFFRGLRYYFL